MYTFNLNSHHTTLWQVTKVVSPDSCAIISYRVQLTLYTRFIPITLCDSPITPRRLRVKEGTLHCSFYLNSKFQPNYFFSIASKFALYILYHRSCLVSFSPSLLQLPNRIYFSLKPIIQIRSNIKPFQWRLPI